MQRAAGSTGAAAGAAHACSTRRSRSWKRARGERERDARRTGVAGCAAEGGAGRGRSRGGQVAAADRAGRPAARHGAARSGARAGSAASKSVLGDALEAVHVESLDAAGCTAGGSRQRPRDAGRRRGTRPHRGSRLRWPRTCAARRPCCGVWRASARPTRCRKRWQRRHAAGRGESLVTPDGIWVGRDWLRVARGRDAHAGVLERESRIRALRGVCETLRCRSAGHRTAAAGPAR